METKPRILYLQKILLERTDEENPLSTTQLINILNDEYGISAHRTTVTKDIAALQEFGMDIVTIHSTQSKYFVASRKFELPELKLLIDAVESSKFITSKKSDALIEKIHTMTRIALSMLQPLQREQEEAITKYCDAIFSSGADTEEFFYRLGLKDGLKLRKVIKSILKSFS